MTTYRKKFKRLATFARTNANKLRQLVLWIPVLSFILGIAISMDVYHRMNTREVNEQKAESIKRSREIMQSLDLLLSNSILRIQSYEEYIGSRPSDYRRDIIYLGQSLRYTIFQRFSIYQKSGKQQDGLPNMKLVARVSTPNSTVPAAASKQISSTAVLKAIKSQIANKEYSRAVLHERENVALITYIIQSRNNPNIFFLFSAPLLNLFEKIDLRASESMDIEDSESGHGWTISSDGNNKSIRYNDDILAVQNSENTLQTLRLGEPQQTGLKVHFHFSPSIPKGHLRPPVITALLSILLTWIISYLFWVLVTQNRQVSRLVIEKTHDLEKTHQDLQEALFTKSRFLGSISHEIRTPLNLILGMIDLCEEKDTDQKVKEYLSSMRSSGNHLLTMIEDLIDLAKAETNELQVQPKRVNLMNFLNEVAKISGQDCCKKNLRLYTQYSPELPSAVKCDPSRLRQILLNLLRNACKYTNQGHVILRVSTEPHPNPQNTILKFEIEDTGVGIQQDKLLQVFDAFFQVENSYALSEGGVGLGLAIVKELVKKLNGTVSVQSTPKKGSIFQVVLEMEVLDASPWTELFKNPTETVRDVILVSRDEFLAKSLWPLGLHPTVIFNHVNLLNELGPLMGTTKDHNKWFILDETKNHFSVVDIDSLQRLGNVILLGDRDVLLSKHPGLNAPILSTYPVLLSDVMTATGFVLKTARRTDRDGKEKAAGATRQAGLPNDLKILVADDDMGNQELYQAYFEEKPWDIKYTLNGAEAFDSFTKNPPQVVILDVRMPVMDGFEAAAKIRQYEKSHGLNECPILLVTADALEETMEQAHEISNVKFLTKPIRKSVLMDSLSQSVK